MPRRQIVCLANSVKYGEYCFAGVDPETHEWIRPTGGGLHGAVRANEQRLDDGALAELLEVIDVPLSGPNPQGGQPENWSLADGQWERVEELSEEEGRALLEDIATDEPLFGNRGKAVPASVVEEEGVESSLAIVQPAEITWRKDAEGGVYAVFEHCGRELALKVTDPSWTSGFDELAAGDYEGSDGSTFLTVSLAEAHNGWHTKLVAGVIVLEE